LALDFRITGESHSAFSHLPEKFGRGTSKLINGTPWQDCASGGSAYPKNNWQGLVMEFGFVTFRHSHHR